MTKSGATTTKSNRGTRYTGHPKGDQRLRLDRGTNGKWALEERPTRAGGATKERRPEPFTRLYFTILEWVIGMFLSSQRQEVLIHEI